MANSNQESSPPLLTRVTPRYPFYLKKYRNNKNGPTNGFKSTGPGVDLLSRISESPTINSPPNRNLIDRLEIRSPLPTLTAVSASQPSARLSSAEIIATLQNSAALQDMLKSAQNTSADTAETDISNEVLGPSPIVLQDDNAAEQAEKATPVAEGPSSSQISPSSSTSSVAGVEDQLIPDHSNLNSPIENPPPYNARAQSSELDGDSLEKMKALMTDEVCAKNLSVAKEQLDAKKAEEEMLAKLESGNVVIGVKRPREDGDGNVVRIRPLRISALEQTERSISTSPDKIPPRAPKAMIEQARVLDRFDRDGEINSGSKQPRNQRDSDGDVFRSGGHSRRNSRQSDVDTEREKDYSQSPRRKGSHDYSTRIRDPRSERSTSGNRDLPPTLPAYPGNPVPGVWFVKAGLDQIEILNVDFEVHPDMKIQDSVSVHLLCLPRAEVEQTMRDLDPAASPEIVMDTLWKVKTEWPSKGKVVMELNPGDIVGRSWLPRDFDSSTTALDVTTHLKPGQNRLRLIHLGDLSSFIFLLHAMPTEQRRNSLSSLGSSLNLKSDTFQLTRPVPLEPQAV